MRRPSWESIAYVTALAAASLGLWLALTASPYFVTNDGPQHIMMGHIENVYEGENPIYRHFLAPAPQYAGRGFAALFVPLESFLPWRTAYRLTVFAILLAWSWGFVALVHAIDPRRRWLGLLGFATAFQWSVYMGFFAFVAGTACGLLLLAFALSRRRLEMKQFAILSVGLLLHGFLHVFSALLTASVISVVLAARSVGWRQRTRAVISFGIACLPLAVLFGLTLLHQASMSTQPEQSTTMSEPLLQRMRYLHRCFQPGSNLRGIAIVALALLGVIRGLRKRSPSRDERALMVVSCLFLVTGALTPDTIPGWQFFSQRFLPLGLMLAIALIDLERAGVRARPVVALALGGVTAAMIFGAGSVNRRLYDRAADVYASLDAPIRRTGMRLPIVREAWNAIPPAISPVPWMAPLHSAFGLFVAQQGGMVPYMFAYSAPVHGFVWRSDALEKENVTFPPHTMFGSVARLPLNDPKRLRALDEYAVAGTACEDVLLLSEREDADRLRERGYVDDFQNGQLYLGHYKGCDAEAVLPAAAAGQVIQFGWWPWTSTGRRVTLEGATPAADGRLHVALPGAPCGRVWLKLESKGLRCLGADAEGVVFGDFPVGRRGSIRCDL